MDKYDEYIKDLKVLEKEETKELNILSSIGNRYIYEKDGKHYLSRSSKEEYLRYKEKHLLPLFQKIDELKKKMLDYLIENDLVIPMYVELIDLAKPKLNGKAKYCRILIRLHKDI